MYLTRLRYWRRRPERLGAEHDVAQCEEFSSGDGATPEAETVAAHLLDVANSELSRMSEKNRVAYILLKEEELSAKEAAAVLGATVEAVKQRAHRAYEQLRRALEAANGRDSHDANDKRQPRTQTGG